MLNPFIPHPTGKGVCVYNSSKWQVTELHGGILVELLRKKRVIAPDDAARRALALHDCYPSVAFQGDDALAFMSEITAAQAKLSNPEVDRLVLDQYLVLECLH